MKLLLNQSKYDTIYNIFVFADFFIRNPIPARKDIDMTKIYIARHGQTESNLRHACIGLKDVPLTDTGKEQAHSLAERLAHISFEAIYTSPLSRAVDTAMPVAAFNKNTPLTMNYGIIERDFGKWDDLSFDEIESKYPNEFKAWRQDKISYTPPGGESVSAMYGRAAAAMTRILNQHSGGNILIVSHLAVSRTILAFLLGLPPEHSQCFFLDNAKAAVIEHSGGKGIMTGLNI